MAASVLPGDPRQKVCIVPHLGMGDMLVLKGLVKTACDQRPEVLLFAKRLYISSLRSLFADLPNLRLKFVDEAHELHADGCKMMADAAAQGYALVRMGVHSGSNAWRALDPVWSRALYRQAGLDPGLMHTAFSAQRDEGRERALLHAVRRAVGDVFVVLHDDPSRGMHINRRHCPPGMPVVHVNDPRWRTANIFDYAGLLEQAIQFHGIDSCFVLMADLLALGARTFCHAYCKDADMPADLYRGDVVMVRKP